MFKQLQVFKRNKREKIKYKFLEGLVGSRTERDQNYERAVKKQKEISKRKGIKALIAYYLKKKKENDVIRNFRKMDCNKIKRIAMKSLKKNVALAKFWREDSIISGFLNHEQSFYDLDGNFHL